MKQQHTLTTSKGKQVTVTVELQTSKEVNADGDKVSVPTCELHVITEVKGHGIMAYSEPRRNVPGLPAGAVACLGRVALTEENAQIVEKMIADAKATPEWQEKQQKIKEAAKVDAEYEAHRRKINRAMNQ